MQRNELLKHCELTIEEVTQKIEQIKERDPSTYGRHNLEEVHFKLLESVVHLQTQQKEDFKHAKEIVDNFKEPDKELKW